MICPKCDAFIPDDKQYCQNCGSKIVESESAEKPVLKRGAKLSRKLRSRLILAGIAVVVLAVSGLLIYNHIQENKGRTIAETLAQNLGRSVAVAEKNAEVTMNSSSERAVLKKIIDYDYVLESERAVTVEGIRLPEWAIFVRQDENKKIQQVSYYDFKRLSRNWKGQKASEKIKIAEVEYGMSMKDAQKILSVKPLAITYSNDDVVTYQYKYYYVDKEDQNEYAYNLTVQYGVDFTVKDRSAEENDYVSYLLTF